MSATLKNENVAAIAFMNNYSNMLNLVAKLDRCVDDYLNDYIELGSNGISWTQARELRERSNELEHLIKRIEKTRKLTTEAETK